jgi:hypothetical protein
MVPAPPVCCCFPQEQRDTLLLSLPVSAGIQRGVLSSVAIAQLNPAFCGMHFPRRHPTRVVSLGFC